MVFLMREVRQAARLWLRWCRIEIEFFRTIHRSIGIGYAPFLVYMFVDLSRSSGSHHYAGDYQNRDDD